jgi:hypothetical protein
VRECIRAIEREVDRHPLAPQSLCDRSGETCVIFDNENSHRRRASIAHWT